MFFFCKPQGRPQDLGGRAKIFSSDFGICMSCMAKPCALLGGSGHAPARNFFKTVQLGAYQGVF